MHQNKEELNTPAKGHFVHPDSAERLDAVTLGEFLAALPRDLAVLNDAGNSGAPLRWVEPSELEDPTPYLLDGEFVLTAGRPFLDDGGTKESAEAYVRRLVAAGVAALGFGLEPYFDAVPERVRSACQKHQLTLVQIPSSVPSLPSAWNSPSSWNPEMHGFSVNWLTPTGN